jgi:hypothetical protein
MKPYFAKYLPVEGEIKPGDKFLDKQLGICTRDKENPWVEWKGGITNLVIDEDHKKVKLFLCSRDIQVGDRVWNQHSGYGEVKEIDEENQYLGVKYEAEDCECEEDFEYIVKVIGEISPEATWVKEGDEFDESQFIRYGLLQMGKNRVRCNDEMDQRYLTGYEVSTQCPTCKKFH